MTFKPTDKARKTITWKREDADDDFVWIAKSSWFKKMLRLHGPYSNHLAAARQALQLHKSEAALLSRYITKAIEELKDDCLETSSDGNSFSPLVQKRQCREDETMDKQ